MAVDGVKSTVLTESTTLNELIGNITSNGLSSTRRISFDNLVLQLLASTSLTSGIVELMNDEWGEDIAALETRMDDVEALVVSGTADKAAVKVVSTTNIAIATALENGDTVDGYVLVTGDRVLLVGQTLPAQNGVYVVPASGAASRATDLNTEAELLNATVFVRDGTTGTGQTWKLTTPAPIVVDTTELTWVLKSEVEALAGDIDITSITLPDDSTMGANPADDIDNHLIYGDTANRMLIVEKGGDIQFAFAGSSAQFGIVREMDIATVAHAHHVQNRRHNVDVFMPTVMELANVGFGQSLMVGQQSWPVFTGWNIDEGNYAASTADNPTDHTWMIGDSSYGVGSGFTIIGTTQFNPLTAAVIDPSDPDHVLTAAEIEALVEPTDAHYGESPIDTLTVGFAIDWNDGIRPTREFTSINAAASNNPWDTLIPGQTLNARLEVSVDDRFKPLAETRSGAGQVGVISFWLFGGQFNYPGHTGTTDEATNMTNLGLIRDGFNSMLVTSLGQTKPPVCLVTVPDAQYVRDDDNMGNATAVLKWAFQTPGVWCTGGHYQAHDKSGHLDPNGSRMMGEKARQILSHIIIDQKDWRPVHPVEMLELNNELHVAFHAPVYPLRLMEDSPPPSASNSFHDYGDIPPQLLRNKGFTLVDDSGVVPIKGEPYLSGASVLTIPMGRARVGTMYLWAGKYLSITEGMTLLCDSDRSRARSNYRYVNPPMTSDQNIAELIDEPYDMANWAVVGRWQCPTTAGIRTPVDYGE